MGLSDLNQLFNLVIKRSFVCLLFFHGRSVCAFVLLNIQLFLRCRAETCIYTTVPLHGAAGACPIIAAFHRSKIFQISHTNLVTIVNERGTRHGKQECKGNFHIFRIKLAGKSFHIVIAGRNTDKPFLFRLFIVFHILGYKFRDIAFSFFIKIRMFAAEQIIIVGRSEMKQEIHMEATLQRLIRFTPFGDKRRIRELLIKELPHFFPESNGSFSILILLDEGACHIHTKSVTAHSEPETNHVLHRFQSRSRSFVFR